MITIYAEKPDVAIRIAVSLSDYYHNGKLITMQNVEEEKASIERSVSKDGYIKIDYDNKDCYITWGKGHMATLKQAYDYNPEYKNWAKIPIPFIPDKYEIKVKNQFDYKNKKMLNQPDPWTLKQLDVIKKLFNKSDYIINATDFDREGEVIFAYVYEMVGCKTKYKRAIIESLTEEGLQKTFNNLKDQEFSKSTELAGRGRAIADWVVGANLTSLMSLKYGDRDNPLISIGRVQTPTLNLIVEREKEIQNFKPKDFWRIKGLFVNDEIDTPFEADHETSRFYKEEDAKAIIDKIKNKQGNIIDFTERNSKRKVPFLYSLTTLSMDANSKYSITASETLNIAQELYSKGYITYPRTNSQHLTDDMTDTVDEVLEMLSEIDTYSEYIKPIKAEDRNYTKRHFDSSKVESHYAIIPTNQKPKNLNKKERQIYDLIAKSLIRIIYNDAELKNTEITIDVNGEKFKARGSVIVDKQWFVVDAMPTNMNILPSCKKGDVLNGDYKLHKGKTSPPSRYNDKTLLSAMVSAGKDLDDEELKDILVNTENQGIGRESTRSGIIESVVNRFCKRKGKQIIPTEKGMNLIEVLPIEEIKSAQMTAEWELMLDKIVKEEYTLDEFISNIENKTIEWCEEIKKLPTPKKSNNNKYKTDYTCPICSGSILNFDWGYNCENNKKTDGTCSLFIPHKLAGKKITKKQVEKLLNLEKTEYIEGFMSKKNKPFGARMFINKDSGKLELDFSTGRKCTKCDSDMNKNRMFYYCTNKECNFSFPYIIASKKLTNKNIEDLLTKGKTTKIKGFTSKKGNSFDAYLVMSDDGKVEFEF